MKLFDKIDAYKTAIFDCDGVIFDSNYLKEKGFERIALAYGDRVLNLMKNRLIEMQGETRYKHFEYLIKVIQNEGIEPPNMTYLLDKYSMICRECYLSCNMSQRLAEIKKINNNWEWLVISSSDQKELQEVFAERNIKNLFDKGIYGSPRSKIEIVEDINKSSDLRRPVVMFGDSHMDIELAKKYGYDIVFVSDWSSMKGWENVCKKNMLMSIKNIDSIMLDVH